eukprot:jgi/Picsp_1/6079/NSC_03433-R1_dna mismatch repair protein
MSVRERSVIGDSRDLSSTGGGLIYNFQSTNQSTASRVLNPVSTLSEAVEACVCDCLILQSSDVHVEVDFGRSSFRVIDNGRGLSKEDLRVCAGGGGPVEGRNGSSGIGLGSVCRSAVVDIQSRQQGKFETYRCMCRGGILLEIKPCAEGKSRPGTIVVVKDCFFSQPIPRCLGGGKRSRKEVQQVRSRMQDIALMHPHVTFTLYDACSRRFLLKCMKGRNMEVEVRKFFGNVGDEVIVPLSFSSHGIVVEGWSVLPPAGHTNRTRQRVFVNETVVSASVVSRIIQELYNEVYTANCKLLPNRQGELQSLRKQLNSHPMFVVIVKAAEDTVGNCLIKSMDCVELNVGESRYIIDAIRAAFLSAWRRSLNGRLLNSIDQACAVDAAPIVFQGFRKLRHAARDARNNEKLLQHAIIADAKSQKHLERMHIDVHEQVTRPQWEWGLSTNGFKPLSEDKVDSSTPSKNRMSMSTSLAGMASDRRFEKRKFSLQNSAAVLDGIIQAWDNPSLMPFSSQTSFFGHVSTVQDLEVRCFEKLCPDRVSRDNLMNCGVLNQIDTKFIPIVTDSGLVALIDQHAADERVMLEQLLGSTVLPCGRPNLRAVSSWALPEAQKLRVGSDEYLLFEQMGSLAAAWGWKWQPWNRETETIMVTHVPAICYRALTAADLKLYIHQLDETAGCRLLPPGVHRLLASKACRSAIMFGDPLTKEQSRDLVKSLASTNLFFECAHGRPTVIPLIDLARLDATRLPQSCVSGDPSSSHCRIDAPPAGGPGLGGLRDRISLALLAETL